MAEFLSRKDVSSEERMEYFDGLLEKGEMSNETLMEHYNAWGKLYDTDMAFFNYSNHDHVRDEVEKHFPDNKGLKILDIAAGTGAAGKKLNEAGYTNIDAIDGSIGMLEEAKRLNVYNNLYQEIISTESIKSVAAESYDLVVSSGSFGGGHITGEYLKPIVETVKKGGMLIISGAPYNDKGINVRPAIEALENAGTIEKLSDERIENWLTTKTVHDGFMICLRKK